MARDYEGVTIRHQGGYILVENAWPMRIGICWELMEHIGRCGAHATRVGDTVLFEVANGSATYVMVDRDDKVWIGHLRESSYQPASEVGVQISEV